MPSQMLAAFKRAMLRMVRHSGMGFGQAVARQLQPKADVHILAIHKVTLVKAAKRCKGIGADDEEHPRQPVDPRRLINAQAALAAEPQHHARHQRPGRQQRATRILLGRASIDDAELDRMASAGVV